MIVGNRHQLNFSWFFLLVLVLAAVASVIVSLFLGADKLSFAALLSNHSIEHQIFISLRLPRVCCAFIVGSTLALSGALMQTLLGNPLADPYVLGISGGSAFAVLAGLCLGLTPYLGTFAFLGGLVSMIIVYWLSQTKHQLSSNRLLLTGIVVAAGWSALISFILTVAPDKNLRGMIFWLMGDLSYAHFSVWQLIILATCLIIAFSLSKPLNILTFGNMPAKSLGVNTNRLMLILYLLTALLTACAVSIAGCIGFVGLIVPHMLRLIGGSDHRFILPASVLLGGTLLTLADLFSRWLFAPIQLPVGIITAFIGVPVYLFLLRRHHG